MNNKLESIGNIFNIKELQSNINNPNESNEIIGE
jgi:hypothetical protein